MALLDDDHYWHYCKIGSVCPVNPTEEEEKVLKVVAAFTNQKMRYVHNLTDETPVPRTLH